MSGSGHARRTIGLTEEVKIGALIRRNMFPSAEVLGFTNRDGCVRRIADLACRIFARSSTAFALPGANSFNYKIIVVSTARKTTPRTHEGKYRKSARLRRPFGGKDG